MNRNAVFAAINNFERTNSNIVNTQRRLENQIQRVDPLLETYVRLATRTPRPMTRKNANAVKYAKSRYNDAMREQIRLANALPPLRNQQRNAFQRLAQSVRGLYPLPAHFQIQNVNANNARYIIRQIRGLQNLQRTRRASAVARKWLTKSRQRKVVSAHVSLKRSGLPVNLARNISKLALNE